MSKNVFLILFVLIVGMVFSGCATDKSPRKIYITTVKKVNPVDNKIATRKKELAFLNSTPIKEFVVTGEGIAPQNTISPAQALVLAKRAAVADAYRQLGEKLYGVKVNAKDTVRDAIVSDSRIITKVNGLIKNASVVENSYKDGIYRVKMELKIDSVTWKRIFSY